MSKIFLAIVFVFGSFINLSAQGLSEDTKTALLVRINSKTADTVLDSIKIFKVFEAIPLLEQHFWEQPAFTNNKMYFLETLDTLNAPHLLSLSQAFLDSLKVGKFTVSEINFESIGKRVPFYEGVGSAMQAFRICFKKNDFSRVEYFFEYLNNLKPVYSYGPYLQPMLELAKNQEFKERLKPYFETIFKIANSKWPKAIYLEKYQAVYKDSALLLAKYVAVNDTSEDVRAAVIWKVLRKYRGPDLVLFYKERLAIETDQSIILNSIAGLLKDHTSPQNYLFVKDRFNYFSDEVKSSLIINGFYQYIPKKPEINYSVKSMIDSLLSYHNQCYSFNWLGDEAFSIQLQNLINDAKTKLISADSLGAALKIKQYQSTVFQAKKDSLADRLVTEDGYKFLYYYPKYILERLPKLPTTKLEDSQGNLLNNGSLQYYEGAWKDAINNNDGTFTIPTTLKNVSLRMNYAYGSQTKNNIAIGTDSVVFQTVNTQVKLQNNLGAAIDTGKVQYYAGAWREFGSTSNGVASKELLPGNYSFRITYAYASKDKAQDIGVNSTVIFQTVNTTVQLKNSLGNFIDQGTVQYYSGAWRDFGATTNGIAVKELLPNNYSFRMNYAFASKDKAQDVGIDPTVVFQTVPATVELKNSLGNFIDQGTVQYYSGAWRDFGATTNGIAVKELLPNNYSFRMNYAFSSKDKAQDIGVDPNVVFQTVNTNVQLKNSLGNFIDLGTVQYYSGAWRDFGVTTNGAAVKELLPNNYSFRMNYAYASKDKTQDVGINPIVVFQTVNAVVQLKNSLGEFIDRGTVQYYSGAWRNFGSTTNGIVSLELLPNNYSFRMTYEFISSDKAQDVGLNNTVNFSTVLCRINVKNSQSQPVDDARISYYSGAWRVIGNTVNGTITKELLPSNLQFRLNYGTTQQDKTQNILTNNIIEFGL